MPRLHQFYYAAAFLHLVMITLFASHFAEWTKPDNLFVKGFSTIGNYSGSNNIFSFFAPGLSDQPYVVYAIKDTLNKEHIIDLTGKSSDFTNRVNNIYGYLTIPEARQVFSASLATFMLDQYPDAEKIRVAMVVQQIPTMPEFRDGQRCQWHFWFQRDFKKSDKISSHL